MWRSWARSFARGVTNAFSAIRTVEPALADRISSSVMTNLSVKSIIAMTTHTTSVQGLLDLARVRRFAFQDRAGHLRYCRRRCSVRIPRIAAADGFPRLSLRRSRRVRWYAACIRPYERHRLADALSLSSVVLIVVRTVCDVAAGSSGSSVAAGQDWHLGVLASRHTETCRKAQGLQLDSICLPNLSRFYSALRC